MQQVDIYGLDIETDGRGDGVDPTVAAVRAVALAGPNFDEVFTGDEATLLADLDARARHDERDPNALLIRGHLVDEAMGAEVVAVVGGDDEDRVLKLVLGLKHLAKAIHHLIHGHEGTHAAGILVDGVRHGRGPCRRRVSQPGGLV